MEKSLQPDARIRFVRTPRYLWPFNGEASAFWPPLGFLSLAAALRQRFPSLRVSVLDCPALKLGWKSLERSLRRDPPDVLCVGEETVSSPEGRRLAALAKRIRPDAVVIAGGVYFSYAVEDTFAEGDVDYIVRGEGEETLCELIAALIEGGEPADVRGLAWPDDEGLRINSPRQPILEMDRLPRPAYDLVPVRAYGRNSRNHPALATLEHSRGCIDRCAYCILWKHFGRAGSDGVEPCYRSKSPERTVAETEWLAKDYGRRTVHFVDPTFNVRPEWNDRFAELMLAAEPDVRFTAWMRPDCIVRDERLGIMEKLVRAGLMQVYVGIERDDDQELAALNRHGAGREVTREAFGILRERYPEVFTIGTVIYGMPWESEETLRRLRDFHYECPVDYAFHIPLAPNPGTDIRGRLQEEGLWMSEDFRQYNFFTPVAETRHLSRGELEDFYSHLLLHFSGAKLRSALGACNGRRNGRIRRVYRKLLTYALKVSARQLGRRLVRPFLRGATLHARKPGWYNS